MMSNYYAPDNWCVVQRRRVNGEGEWYIVVSRHATKRGAEREMRQLGA